MRELIAEYETAMAAYKSAPRERHQQSPWETYPARFLAFAEAKHDAASLAACQYLIRKFYISPERYDAIELASKHHLDKDGIGEFFAYLIWYDEDLRVEECLTVAMKSDIAPARVHATYQYARLLIDRRNWCLEGDTARYEDGFDETQIAAMTSEERRKQIVALLKTAAAEAGDIKYLDQPLARWIKQDLFTIERLEIGRPAPEVEGRDSKGQVFRLSDYRGKVVVVTFWANWCSACMANLRDETKFVATMRGRPMVWLGVNGDEDVKLLQKTEAANTVNFRSWHDGQHGPIAELLGVRGWPAMYVFDADGVIRYRSRISVDFEQAAPIIESLVEQLEAQRSNAEAQ